MGENMRLPAISIYLIIMLCFYFEGFVPAFYTMLILGVIFIFSSFLFKTILIRSAKLKIYETLKASNSRDGRKIPPFIDVNLAPWYILAELPGMNTESAKIAVKVRAEKGLYPSMESFIKTAEIKPRYITSLLGVAYAKKKK